MIRTGALEGNPDGGVKPIDAHMPPPPDGMSATCPTSGVTDVGAASAFAAGSPVYVATGNFFVVRDAGGLYALTAVCTHQGYTLVSESGVFHCKLHGAHFTFDGAVIDGPVILPLVHYAMCTLANGHVGVITSQVVSASQRLQA